MKHHTIKCIETSFLLLRSLAIVKEEHLAYQKDKFLSNPVSLR